MRAMAVVMIILGRGPRECSVFIFFVSWCCGWCYSVWFVFCVIIVLCWKKKQRGDRLGTSPPTHFQHITQRKMYQLSATGNFFESLFIWICWRIHFVLLIIWFIQQKEVLRHNPGMDASLFIMIVPKVCPVLRYLIYCHARTKKIEK